MKEFEFNNNQNIENGQGNVNNPADNKVQNAENNDAVSDNAVHEANIEDQDANNAQNPQNTPNNPNPMADNPYFRGYYQPNNTYGNNQPQAPQYQQNVGQREYPYGNREYPNQHRDNQFSSYGMNGGQYNYGNNNDQNRNQQYGQYNNYRQQYDQSRGQISYTPAGQPRAKKSKERKPMSSGAIVALCLLMLVLSAGAGFSGAILAGRFTNGTSVNSAVSGNSEPVVIYKSVEDVATSTGTSSTDNLTYAQVAAMVKDSVVEIVTEYNNQSMWYQYVTQGAGSGVVISADGYIITNAHVIINEDTGAVADNIIVRLTNSTEYTAAVVAYDSDSDIAILKIEADGLQPAQCGNSDNLAVGEELMVVGNPLGELGGTVTNGIVSATQREIQMGGVTMSLIQTNAAVNPGNSGGGMFNMKGQLVGIVNAKSSGTGIEGLGFAIPINYALEISEQLLEFGYVRGKSMIGVTFQEVSGSNYFFYYNIKAGVYVSELMKGYNDDVLRVGDRVIAVNGNEISSSADIKAVVTSTPVGEKIKFQLYRNDKFMEVDVTCYLEIQF